MNHPTHLSTCCHFVVCPQLDLSDNKIGGYYENDNFVSTPEGPKAIADALLINASLTVTDMRFNQLDTESATMLATIAKEKSISLCGIVPGQTEANFQEQGLRSADAILVASDLFVRAELTKIE